MFVRFSDVFLFNSFKLFVILSLVLVFGDEVVLLLEKRQGQPGWMFTGLAQGVFWVRRDQVVPLAYRNLSNITLVREGEHLHGGVERPQSLHGLLDILRKLVEGVR